MTDQVIINIRGTSGSGKSTLARRIMELYDSRMGCVYDRWPKRRRPAGYLCNRNDSERPLFVVGHYESACGGADTFNSYDDVFGLVREAHANGSDVLFEGVIPSTDFTWTRALHNDGLPLVVIGLDVPLEVCIESVNRRRRAKNPDAPAVRPKTTESKYRSTQSAMNRLQEAGVDAMWAGRDEAFDLICERLGLAQQVEAA